jgi:septum formation protein
MSFLPFVVLASSSPRRQQLVRQMGADFTIAVPDIDERLLPGEDPAGHVERLALEKALAISPARHDGVVLGSDTIVVLDGVILGKPADRDHARRTLATLSGRTHTVFTGFALVDIASGRRIVSHERTDVTFRALGAAEIDHYVEGGSPMDKAGAYGIQDDFGAVFIERIEGDYYTVVGLPLCRVYVALRELAGAADDQRA